MNVDSSAFEFGTKGETLARLAPLVDDARFCDQLVFTVKSWRAEREVLVEQICSRFYGATLVVRSSSLLEDSHAASMAGVFDSVMSVEPNGASIIHAVERVIESYGPRSDANQVLVQPMVGNVAISGVVVTRELSVGGPYYVINYDDFSGRTDTVTSGAQSKTLLIHHASTADLHSPRFSRLIEIVETLQIVCSNRFLDIEFCIAGDDIYILQVRPLTMHARWQAAPDDAVSDNLDGIRQTIQDRSPKTDAIIGDSPVYSDMADWNPAEMIGQTPRPLALSLYQRLITDRTWCEARQAMGYRGFMPEPLLITLGGRPYIDVRLSLNSLLPDGINLATADAIVTHQLAMLREHRDLHDKFEFEVAVSSLDFTFKEKAHALAAAGIGRTELVDLEDRLCQFTNACLASRHGGLQKLADRTRGLGENVDTHDALLRRAIQLLDNCRISGTYPFSLVARHAFIAMAFVKALVARGAVEPSSTARLMGGIRTVAADIVHGMYQVSNGAMALDQFLAFCGHLRPGTYDILSSRYDAAPDLYLRGNLSEPPEIVPFAWTTVEDRELRTLLNEHSLQIDPDGLLDYIRQSVAGREQIKFDFTRNISEALENLAQWGETLGLDRDDVSYLTIDAIEHDANHDTGYLREMIAQRRQSHAVTLTVRLPEVVTGIDDVGVVRMPLGKPTFTTQQSVTARCVNLDRDGADALEGAIVLIEAADPGYDWVLSHGVAGLVTKFGGANSHIAIRCAEFGLPAAIGCGERLFEALGQGSVIELDCATRSLRPIA